MEVVFPLSGTVFEGEKECTSTAGAGGDLGIVLLGLPIPSGRSVFVICMIALGRKYGEDEPPPFDCFILYSIVDGQSIT